MPMRWGRGVVTASTWMAATEAVFKLVQDARGLRLVKYPGIDGEMAERKTAPLCNADVIAIVMSVLADVPQAKKRWALWYQFAAIAYGWDPERSDTMDTSAAQGAKWYPALFTVELWKELASLATSLDIERTPEPRFDLDGQFTDPVFAGEVRRALLDDGAEAQFKIPIPHKCKGGQNRKCTKKMKVFPYACLEWEKCEPASIEIDPLKPIRQGASNVFAFLVLVVGIWALASNEPRRSRRSRG